MQVVKATNLTKVYGDRKVVDSIDLGIERGMVFGFLGPNGAGKTTTIRMLLGLVRPTAGEIEILGKNARTEGHSIAGRISAIVEVPTFFPYMSAYQALRTYADYLPVKTSKTECASLLDRCGLSDAADKRVEKFSLGMRQRLGIAVALLGDPEVIFLDEPTNGLDPTGILEVRDLFKALAGEGKTIFVSSHILSEVERVCDVISIIDKGRVKAAGKVQDLLESNSTRLKAEPFEKAVALLREKFPAVVFEASDGNVVIARDSDRVPQIVEMLSTNGVSIYEVTRVQPKLEDYFQQVVSSDR